MYVREREWVGASRWSWDETVRLTGRGKKGSGAWVDAGVDVDADVDGVGAVLVPPKLEVEGSSLSNDTFESDVVLFRVGAGVVVMPKVSPAPSQSELVKSGV